MYPYFMIHDIYIYIYTKIDVCINIHTNICKCIYVYMHKYMNTHLDARVPLGGGKGGVGICRARP